ncbi:transcription termination factor MTERF9, chloroplastic-like [Chenopodium quinoa]|uniref:transcription termination factor MTERF9, chloroplastic-like n=1 Tax=Chenopodium quinoa TaxID=63459 RepID=UPI000B79A8A4|nr:transcription termination factor MTERF9, chloroplastic-like [Chenopodium quinoa]
MLKLGSCSYGVRSLCFFLRHPLFYSTSTSLTNHGNPSSSSSFSISLSNFLVDNLGFSNQQSLSISAKLTKTRKAGETNKAAEFNFFENADSVIQFFKQLGFQQSHIQKIIICEPRYLVSRAHKTLKPKIQLFNDLGMSESDVIQTILRNPIILRQRLGPTIHALKNVLGSDENVVTILKKVTRNLQCTANYFIPNVELLQKYCGISSDTIQKHILRRPNSFIVKTDLLRDTLIKVELQLGIPRDSSMFFYGVNFLLSCGEKNIKDKCEVFKSFGWTQSDIMKLIRLNPLCFTSSEARIKERLGYLMNQMGYKPNYLATQPILFMCSKEKRLLPRHRVLQILQEKGLIRMDYLLSSAVSYSESVFLKRFVLPFEEVHEVYAQLIGSTLDSLNVGRSKSQS